MDKKIYIIAKIKNMHPNQDVILTKYIYHGTENEIKAYLETSNDFSNDKQYHDYQKIFKKTDQDIIEIRKDISEIEDVYYQIIDEFKIMNLTDLTEVLLGGSTTESIVTEDK